MSDSLLDKEFQRILLINFGGIGDEILFFPVIHAIRSHYRQARLAIVAEPRCKTILENNYFIDEVYTFDIKNRRHPGDLLELLSLIRTEAPEMVISSGSSPLVSLLLFLSGTPYRVGYASSPFFSSLFTHTSPLSKNQYAAKMYYDLLISIGFPEKNPVPEIYLPTITHEWAQLWLRSQNIKDDEPFILIHPGVSLLSKKKQMIKSWAVTQWESLIHKLLEDGHTVVLAGGPDDLEEVTYLQHHIHHKKFVSSYGYSKNIYQLAALIQRSEIMVCVDSAPMHLGVALNAKMVAIFGPTDEKKLLPSDRQNIQVINFDIACRPCLWRTRETTCSTLACLNEIDVFSVYQGIQKLWNPSLKLALF